MASNVLAKIHVNLVNCKSKYKCSFGEINFFHNMIPAIQCMFNDLHCVVLHCTKLCSRYDWCSRSLLSGMMWFVYDGQFNIRHTCEHGDKLQRYGWVRHDGTSFGQQEIIDNGGWMHYIINAFNNYRRGIGTAESVLISEVSSFRR